MLISIYLVLMAVVGFICVYAVSQDEASSIFDIKNIGFIFLVALLWPLTLPSILWKKMRQLKRASSDQKLVTDPCKTSQ